MNDHLEDRLRSMLAARARSAPLEPDLDRVVTDGSDGSPRAAVERVAFFAAVAAILAIVVSAALVFTGGAGDEDAFSGAASGVAQDPTLGAGAEFSSTTFDVSTTTALTSDCVVRTTEGAGARWWR